MPLTNHDHHTHSSCFHFVLFYVLSLIKIDGESQKRPYELTICSPFMTTMENISIMKGKVSGRKDATVGGNLISDTKKNLCINNKC